MYTVALHKAQGGEEDQDEEEEEEAKATLLGNHACCQNKQLPLGLPPLRCRYVAMRQSSIRLTVSLLELPSTPNPTLPFASRIPRT